MTTDYRAMCAELANAYEHELNKRGMGCDLITRARALLAQPEPEGPTDEEIEEWADACSEAPLEEMDPEVHGWRRCFTAKEFSETIRAALARWGRPTLQPVAVSERLPGPGDCDEQGRCWWHGEGADMIGWTLDAEGASYYRAKFWLPANALPTPKATNG